MSGQSYHLLDSGYGQKLEKVGPYCLIRPALQALWSPADSLDTWRQKADFEFRRDDKGRGRWVLLNDRPLPNQFSIDIQNMKLNIQMTDFGHLGIFAEQHPNWAKLSSNHVQKNDRILNLFAYTGASSIAAALAGAQVTHVDASKASVQWARNNADLNGVDQIRWIVEDVQKYLKRLIKRQECFDGIILDPPSFGRGPAGQLWKIEEHLTPLIKDLKQLSSKSLKFILMSAHTTGVCGQVLENILQDHFDTSHWNFTTQSMSIEETSSRGRSLPSGFEVWMLPK